MTLTLTGENTYAIAAAEQQLLTAFKAKHGIHGIERVDGESFDPRGLHGLLQGASLFATEQLILIKDAAKNKPLWEALGEWINKVPAETTLVIIEPNPDKRTKTYKTLKSHSDFKEFAIPGDAELVKWLQAKSGNTLGQAEARHVVRRVGPDQWRLHNEVEKLAGHTSVTTELIDSLVEQTPEGTAFELLDATLAGRAKAVEQLIAQLKTEEDPYKLFGLLASQVYALALVATGGTRSADTIAKDAGVHPFVVRKTQNAAGRLGMRRVTEIVDAVATCDAQLKSTGADPWQLLGVTLQRIAVER